MSYYKATGSSSDSAFEIIYENCTADAIIAAIEDSFLMDGYSVKSGELGDRTYVKGNRVARLLLGAFYKYFEFHVGVQQMSEANMVVANVRKTTSGMSGGMIGVSQVKKELRRLEACFELF